jgi:hypothetical protein
MAVGKKDQGSIEDPIIVQDTYNVIERDLQLLYRTRIMSLRGTCRLQQKPIASYRSIG